MIDIKHKRCKTYGCYTRVDKHKYCLTCSVNLGLNTNVVRNYKTKEQYIVDKIKQQFNQYTIIHDKTIEGGCSKKRPDIYINFGSYVLIIELDEDQHKNYECERK